MPADISKLIETAIAGLHALHQEIDAAVAATNLDKDLRASLKSLEAAHSKALSEREIEQRSFDLEKQQHDKIRKEWAADLKGLRDQIVVEEKNLKAVVAETTASKELHDRILSSMSSLQARLSGARTVHA